MIYGGDGLARLPADEKGRGKAVFVPFTLSGERVEAAVHEEKPGFARAGLSRILQASPQRIDAMCPYFQRCGGCHYQHTSYEQQLRIKAEILKENLARLAKTEFTCEIQVHPSPPWNYRNRTRLQVRTVPEFALGYFHAGSHDLLPVETCPISSPLLNRAIAALWAIGRGSGIPHEVSAIECFADADDQKLQFELYTTPPDDLRRMRKALQSFTESLRAALPEMVSAYAFEQSMANLRGHRAHIVRLTESELMPGVFQYQTRKGPLRVSGGSFFQVNRHLVDDLVETVTAGRGGEFALDLYAGVGLFTMALASSFRHTVAVESSQGSVRDLQYNSAQNVKAVRSTVDEYLTSRHRKGVPDFVVADPPRAGLGERVTRELVKLGASRLIYVSCDPATLSRDLKSLLAGGYHIAKMHLIDLFPQTFHIETVVELAR